MSDVEHNKEQMEFLKEHIVKLEQRIQEIEFRNARVESDKAWERSHARRMLIALLTYLVTTLVFLSLEVPKPLFNALIPAVAYWLSTLSLPVIKRMWLKSQE